MAYQQCRYQDNIEKIPVRDINGQFYMFLSDVHDCFPDIRRFTWDGNPIPFEHGEDNIRLEPYRIPALSGKIIDCHTQTSNGKVVSKTNDDLEQQTLLQICTDLKKTLQNTENLKNKVDTIPRQTLELAEYTVPHLFIILPELTTHYNPANWIHLNYRLYFLCECENDDERHFAFHEGYNIKRPRKFLRQYGPHLRKMLTVVKHVISAGSIIVPELKPIACGISHVSIPQDPESWNNLTIQIDRLDEILTKAGVSEVISSERKNYQFVEGAELRGFEDFLKKTDVHRTFGNLVRSFTKNGHVRWMCIQHCEGRYADTKVQDLKKEFQKLGGEINDDVAIIQGKASDRFLEILTVLRQGLPIFSILLKDLKLTGDMFNDLLNFLSQQPIIHKLELENITVLNRVFNIKKRDIISKLKDIITKNSKLNILYSFTQPLSKFKSILKDATDVIPLTNSRLVFRVRSEEDLPSLEVAGTNETGFILSINNSGDKDEISRKTALKDVFSMVPNITKILLHAGVISESSWTCFKNFLTTKQTLQELTIDCLLTLEQTEDLSQILRDNTTLKTLHMFNVWERRDELKGFEEIFKILHTNTTLTEFTLTCHTDRLRLGFIARCLLQNKSLRVLRLSKCRIYQNTDIELFEDFLENTSIHTLSLESVCTNCETSFERLVHAKDNNKTLKIFELQHFDYSAIRHQKPPIPDRENSLVCTSSVQNDSNKGIILLPVDPIQSEDRKYISIELFYALRNHPSFYKQTRESAQNLKLEELLFTSGPYVEVRNSTLSMKSNFNITRIKIGKRVLTENDIEMLLKSLHDNTTITHLNWNGIQISFAYFRQIFDVSSNDRTLPVLDVSQCICYSNRHLFTQEVEALELNNPSLKMMYENPLISDMCYCGT